MDDHSRSDLGYVIVSTGAWSLLLNQLCEVSFLNLFDDHNFLDSNKCWIIFRWMADIQAVVELAVAANSRVMIRTLCHMAVLAAAGRLDNTRLRTHKQLV